MTEEQKKQRLRAAIAKLRAAVCTCDGKHDPYWARCPRSEAKWERDNALAIVKGLP